LAAWYRRPVFDSGDSRDRGPMRPGRRASHSDADHRHGRLGRCKCTHRSRHSRKEPTMRRALTAITSSAFVAAAIVATGALTSDASAPAPIRQQAELARYIVVPSSATRFGSPLSGAFFSATDRANAAANGVTGPATGAYLPSQPIQGISAVIPGTPGNWWALADNGFGARENSADWQLVIYRLDTRSGSPTLAESVVLSDPNHKVPWKTVCDP